MTLQRESPNRGEVEVFPTREALLAAAAERFAAAAGAAIAARGRFVVALAGGATPEGLYARLAAEPHASRIDWSRVHVFWGDERAVLPGDGASNYRMAREALLDRVPLRPEQIHRIRGEAEPAVAAAAYERELREAFATPTGPPRTMPGARFDLVLLGLGQDGHTASLFPGAEALHERELWVRAERAPAAPPWRITLTPMVVNAAAEVVFLVAGRDKAAALRRVLTEPPQPDLLPAQGIRPTAGSLGWLVDAAATAELGLGA
ncbi:MAG TPA: 6-phosphogluconolactonase [Thermoanaerobaculia bacterium]|nr:6-phosphogluconolactonase [Thermoanaerobaculia bacterium]